jgi:hypothetical protein
MGPTLVGHHNMEVSVSSLIFCLVFDDTFHGQIDRGFCLKINDKKHGQSWLSGQRKSPIARDDALGRGEDSQEVLKLEGTSPTAASGRNRLMLFGGAFFNHQKPVPGP